MKCWIYRYLILDLNDPAYVGKQTKTGDTIESEPELCKHPAGWANLGGGGRMIGAGGVKMASLEAVVLRMVYFKT